MNIPDLRYAVPFFQPIIAVDSVDVFAYEVLAREVRDGKVKSLGPFFEDPRVSNADKLVVDRHIRALALKEFADSGSDAKLFMNMKPSWITAQGQKDEGAVLSLIETLGLDPGLIVIEVTEEELLSELDEFSRLVANYRRRGYLLAIDDFGKGASSIERIACITPDIVKIDSSIVQRMDSHRSFFDICQAMTAFGDISGFDLLFEGVETAYQLERCVAARGKYLQGYVFSKAREKMDAEFENRNLLDSILSIRTRRSLASIRLRNEFSAEMERIVNDLQELVPKRTGDDLIAPDALLALAGALPYYCVRCFVCDMRGRQLSHLYQIGADGKVSVRGNDGSQWLFRDFFAQGLGVLRNGNPGYLSEIHKDVETKGNVATYMHVLTDDRLLCVDIISTLLA
ncbi:MAG: EAL domain-containing protein [Candidatus Accumulibacter sp.]|jgi:EAL domain-containing protein (putative c-di-GMP-specific phosphodiesterase class I)|nr:EAL domain-containing protein [Accumulibacter sp.]